MKTFSSVTAILATITVTLNACAAQVSAPQPLNTPEPDVAVEVRTLDNAPRPPFDFSDDDSAFLDEIQHAAFRFFVEAVDPETGLVCDRTSNPTLVSVAGVGFQLTALPIGVERGWISRDDANALASRIVNALASEPTNRKAGLFFHFLDARTARPHPNAYEHVVSTIDSALLFAGLITASSYFGGEVGVVADKIVAEADWAFFLAPESEIPPYQGYVSLGWRAADKTDPTGEGELLDYYWSDATDEQRLVTFIGLTPEEPDRRLRPEAYYQLRRRLGAYEGSGPMVFSPYSGALFTSLFSHCWIDYAHTPLDDPSAFGFEHRPSVDWWENSRRHVNLHRAKAIENPLGLETPGPDAWGLSASDADGAYRVSMLYPDALPMPGARADWDIQPENHTWQDKWNSGLLAPYAAAASAMFEPTAALAALRHYRSLETASGESLLWRAPSAGPLRSGAYLDGFGFLDSFTLDAPDGKPWVAHDFVAIDQGPMLAGLENARSGLVWGLFHDHPAVRRASGELRLRPESPENHGDSD